MSKDFNHSYHSSKLVYYCLKQISRSNGDILSWCCSPTLKRDLCSLFLPHKWGSKAWWHPRISSPFFVLRCERNQLSPAANGAVAKTKAGPWEDICKQEALGAQLAPKLHGTRKWMEKFAAVSSTYRQGHPGRKRKHRDMRYSWLKVWLLLLSKVMP